MPFNPKFTITPKINNVLAHHYGFTEEELDFIPSASLRTGINYDIKYRIGKALFGENDEEAEDG